MLRQRSEGNAPFELHKVFRNAVIELEGALEAQALVHSTGYELGMLQLVLNLQLLCERR